ncbi:MAG: hypothetical protein K1W19_01370 [Lachnospiraceae bacterium]|jgi:hypothetical protein|nr:hypothetical protein [Lachnospiraceae bacterium]MCI8825292.1 hypothetical protein [Lachnospiraceae bacterium]
MRKKLLVAAGATVLALGMSISAMADVVTSDKDYGAEGSATNSPAWNSAANGQFAIQDNKKAIFKFDSKSSDTSNAAFGWVAEITDGTSYFTVTQGATAWLAPDTAEWKTSGKNNFEIKKSWEDDAAYAAAVADAKNVELTVTRAGKQVIFDSKATGSDGVEYTMTVTGVFDSKLADTLNIQLGSDHGSMVLYSVKYEDAGEVGTPPPTSAPKETITAKPNLNNKAGVASDSSSDEEDSSNTGIIIGVVVAVLVVAVIVGVVVATKKKSN